MAKHPLTEKELTEFVEEAVLVLKEELFDGYLTEQEYQDYVTLVRFAVNRVLAKYSQLREEVNQMTEPLIKLPSMIVKEMLAEQLAEFQTETENWKAEIASQKAEITNQKTQLASKDAEIQRLRELVSQLSSDKPTF